MKNSTFDSIIHFTQKHSTFFIVFFLSYFLVYPYHALFANIEFGDTFLFINRSLKNSTDVTKSMSILTLWIGNQWANLFGDGLLSFRFLAILLSQLSFVIPMFFFYRKKRTLLFISFMLFVAVSIAYKDIATIFGYDVITVFFTVLVFSLFVKYLKTYKIQYLLFSGIFCGLSILARFPNLLVLGIFCLVLFIQAYLDKKELGFKWVMVFLKNFSLVLLVTLSTIALVTFLLFGNCFSYVHALFNTQINETHTSLFYLLYKHIINLGDMFMVAVGFLILFFLYARLNNPVFSKLKLPFLMITFVVVAVLIIRFYFIYRFQVTLFFIMLFYLFFDLLKHPKKERYKENLLTLVSMFFFALAPSGGSDRGIYEQVAVAVYYPVLLPIFFSKISEHYKFLVGTLLASMMVGGVVHNINNPFRFPRGTETIEHEKLYLAKVGKTEKIFVDEVLQKREQIIENGSPVIFLGARQLFTYLTDSYFPYKLVYLATDLNLPQVDKHLKETEEKPHIIFINFNGSYDEEAYAQTFSENNYLLIEKKKLESVSYSIYKHVID